MASLKLYMVLLGCKPQGRNVEQHDVFFGIAPSLRELVPQMESFWPEAGKLHIDAWREVNVVDGHRIEVRLKSGLKNISETPESKLFFINMGGYQPLKFEEQHYILLTVKPDRVSATKEAKQTLFFQNNHFEGAASHIDDKYGIDVDDLYEIEEMLSDDLKNKYSIMLSSLDKCPQDEIHLGYVKLSAVK